MFSLSEKKKKKQHLNVKHAFLYLNIAIWWDCFSIPPIISLAVPLTGSPETQPHHISEHLPTCYGSVVFVYFKYISALDF